jgi:phage FluMu protein Com
MNFRIRCGKCNTELIKMKGVSGYKCPMRHCSIIYQDDFMERATEILRRKNDRSS